MASDDEDATVIEYLARIEARLDEILVTLQAMLRRLREMKA